MTVKQAEQITGLKVIEIRPVIGFPRESPAFAAMRGDVEVVRVTLPDKKECLRLLVESLYNRTKRLVFKQQGYRCLQCNRIEALQCHHIVERTRGRRCDQRFNLTGLCASCHDAITNRKINLDPHPQVLRLVRECGWEWRDSQWHPMI